MNKRLMASENEFNQACVTFELFYDMLKKEKGRAAEETKEKYFNAKIALEKAKCRLEAELSIFQYGVE